MNLLAEKYIRKDALPLIFCSGCGDGIVLNSFIRVIEKMQLRDNLAAVSGIGCSSWIPVYLNIDVIHGLHGRAIPMAEGIKTVRPEKKIVVFTGDGDCMGIGGNHLIHAARRNIDITVIMITNFIYGMTGGQKAPTTPYEAKTKTSPLGNDEYPFDIPKLVISSGATYFTRYTVAHPLQLENSMIDAINHKGFSFIEVLSTCPTQAGKYIFGMNNPSECLNWYKENTYFVKNINEIDIDNNKIPIGCFNRDNTKIEYTDILAKKRMIT